MPNLDFGVYEVGEEVGTEVSSTYEGRHITAHASELNHGTNLAVVTKGYPVIFGTAAGSHGVGVALNTEIAGGVDELIAVDTEGIWNLPVQGMDDGGNAVLTPGTPLFINTTTGDISAIRNNATQIPFGYLMTQCASAAAPAGVDSVQVVKVHWDPRSHWLEDEEMLYFGDAREFNMEKTGINLVLLPSVTDTGEFRVGNGVTILDMSLYGTAIGNYLRFDASADELINIGVAIRIPEDQVLEFGAPDHTFTWTGEEILISGDRVPGAADDYFRCLHAALSVELEALNKWGTISTYTTLDGGAGGATWAGAIVGTLEQLTKQVDGYLAPGIFEFKNSADACSTSGTLWLSIKNQSAVGYGGVMHGFIVCQDTSPADRDTQCLFVLDSMDATIAASATEIVCVAGAANTASHVIKISANGVPYWLMMDSTPPA